MDIEEEKVLEDEYSEQALDNWFDEDEDEERQEEDDKVEEDLSAEDKGEAEEEASTSDDWHEDSPDDEDQEDAAEEAAESGEETTEEIKDDKEDPHGWIKELDPKFRSQVEALIHSDQSNRGRVAAYQRRLDRLTAEQEARERVASDPAAQKAVEKGKDIEEMDDEELSAFMEEFPSVARNVKKMVAQQIAKERESLMGQIRPIQEEATAARLSQQKEQLRSNAYHIFNTAETGVELDDVLSSPHFKEWVANQPLGYQRFARGAESVDDATKVLEDFAQWSEQQVYQEWQQTQQQVAAEQEQQESTKRQKADSVSARRKDALKGSSPRSKSAATKTSGSDDDYESLFNAFADGDIN